ncbi:MAG: hypothetical protein Q8R45_05285 [Brevundimonas sp.]|uniref:hypothetical protein n=1 Tax=Brevundimonas sp. TaxID=1871086 RepID=UPI00271E4C34|nr:hypothetical protein [Brevundimonas sp.]MDO9588607.1 hypothetical protein [Brevundimonas sp.]MDP3369823.1 hypothetical protein [Brevundimonas sp.]MDP3656363.1 hypothetical protein [Brevundimonas sp.]MDZ4113367.1 hypothetical protein [Brevundimonas sp.]
MTRSRTPKDPRLLDDALWDQPRRLTEAELFSHANPGWRRNACPLDDPEDDG